MIVHEFRVKINGNIINHSTMRINCYETEYSYVPNDEDDRKAYNVVQPYKKNLENVPGRNMMFYQIFTSDESKLYDAKTKLMEYIYQDYEKQEKELEKELGKTRGIKNKIFSLEK